MILFLLISLLNLGTFAQNIQVNTPKETQSEIVSKLNSENVFLLNKQTEQDTNNYIFLKNIEVYFSFLRETIDSDKKDIKFYISFDEKASGVRALVKRKDLNDGSISLVFSRDCSDLLFGANVASFRLAQSAGPTTVVRFSNELFKQLDRILSDKLSTENIRKNIRSLLYSKDLLIDEGFKKEELLYLAEQLMDMPPFIRKAVSITALERETDYFAKALGGYEIFQRKIIFNVNAMSENEKSKKGNVINHEFGHAYFFQKLVGMIQLEAKTTNDIKKKDKEKILNAVKAKMYEDLDNAYPEEKISKYSKKDFLEDFAEMFSSYISNPQVASDICPHKYDFMKEYVFSNIEAGNKTTVEYLLDAPRNCKVDVSGVEDVTGPYIEGDILKGLKIDAVPFVTYQISLDASNFKDDLSGVGSVAFVWSNYYEGKFKVNSGMNTFVMADYALSELYGWDENSKPKDFEYMRLTDKQGNSSILRNVTNSKKLNIPKYILIAGRHADFTNLGTHGYSENFSVKKLTKVEVDAKFIFSDEGAEISWVLGNFEDSQPVGYFVLVWNNKFVMAENINDIYYTDEENGKLCYPLGSCKTSLDEKFMKPGERFTLTNAYYVDIKQDVLDLFKVADKQKLVSTLSFTVPSDFSVKPRTPSSYVDKTPAIVVEDIKLNVTKDALNLDRSIVEVTIPFPQDITDAQLNKIQEDYSSGIEWGREVIVEISAKNSRFRFFQSFNTSEYGKESDQQISKFLVLDRDKKQLSFKFYMNEKYQSDTYYISSLQIPKFKFKSTDPSNMGEDQDNYFDSSPRFAKDKFKNLEFEHKTNYVEEDLNVDLDNVEASFMNTTDDYGGKNKIVRVKVPVSGFNSKSSVICEVSVMNKTTGRTFSKRVYAPAIGWSGAEDKEYTDLRKMALEQGYIYVDVPLGQYAANDEYIIDEIQLAKSYCLKTDSIMDKNNIIKMGGNNFWAQEKTFNTTRRDIKVTTIPMELPKDDKRN